VSQRPTDAQRARMGYSSRRRRSTRYEIKNMPPPWKRSLTESGMQRMTTRLDIAAVVFFLVVLAAMGFWVVAVYAPS
jgi:hypothetical protein